MLPLPLYFATWGYGQRGRVRSTLPSSTRPTSSPLSLSVGLAFDGTTEGLASDVVFNGETTRVIHADVRYMLWNMDLLDGADHLLKEMGITPSLQ